MARKEHCFYCFDVISREFNDQVVLAPKFKEESFPLFVTWTKNNNLRGCVGSFTEQSLVLGLERYAHFSAFKDSRFSPISENEMEDLSCSVSLLINFEPSAKWNDWTIGIHGILIEYLEDDQKYSGTFLPEVAKSQNWNHFETISRLMAKMGYHKAITVAFLEQLTVIRYEVIKYLFSRPRAYVHMMTIRIG